MSKFAKRGLLCTSNFQRHNFIIQDVTSSDEGPNTVTTNKVCHSATS